MFVKCNNNQKEEIVSYIGDRYGECLYMYIDLLKYGMENENIHVWKQTADGETSLIVLQYYTGVHLFTRTGAFDARETAEFLKGIAPSMICGMQTTIDQVAPWIISEGYEEETGIVGQLRRVKEFDTAGCVPAAFEEIRELAAVLAEDPSLGKPYGFDLLYRQLAERHQEKFGRNYIYRENGRIVATASTYAENEKVAVISGVFVSPECRGRGLSKRVLSAICSELAGEGRDVFSYYYIETAHRMHRSVGFEDLGAWAKLVKI